MTISQFLVIRVTSISKLSFPLFISLSSVSCTVCVVVIVMEVGSSFSVDFWVWAFLFMELADYGSDTCEEPTRGDSLKLEAKGISGSSNSRDISEADWCCGHRSRIQDRSTQNRKMGTLAIARQVPRECETLKVDVLEKK